MRSENSGRDPCRPELGRFLNNEVHVLPLGNGLRKRDRTAEWLRAELWTEYAGSPSLLKSYDIPPRFVPLAIKHRYVVSHAETKDVENMMRLALVKNR